MNLDRVKASLRLHEGERNLMYQDTEGNYTIGVGHNLDSMPLSIRAIDTILEDDIQTAVDELDRAIPSWRSHSENRQDVMIEMCFNLGMPRLLTFKNFIARLSERDYIRASTEMLLSKWADQVGERAQRLSHRMLNG